MKVLKEYYHKNPNWQGADQLVTFMFKAQPRSWIQSGQMRTNPALISRLEALNSETLDYKTSAPTCLLLCLLKSNCLQKVKCHGKADWGEFYIYLEINFIFIYPILTLIWISLSSWNAGGFIPYKETRCTHSSIWGAVCSIAGAWNVPELKRNGFFLTFAFITKHNSTKHFLQCKTHYATLLTEQYLRYLQCRLLMLAIQY